MNAIEHARVWLAASAALRAHLDNDSSIELEATTITAYKLAYTVGTAYKMEAENAPD